MVKKRKMKPAMWLAVALSASMVLSGCGGGNGNNTNANEGQNAGSNTAPPAVNSEADGPLGKYSSPIKLTTGRIIYDSSWKFAQGKSIDNNKWYDLYRDELGIEVVNDWVINGGDSGTAKINASIASGDIPDLLRVDATQLKNLVEAGMVEDLTEVYEQYASEFTRKQLSEDGGDALKSATFDGKLYAIPEAGSPYNSVPLLWVRTDWLQKLSLEEPKTMEDVVKIAAAFVAQDPDGNNKNDTYGIAAFKDIVNPGTPSSLEGFFNGYHAYPKTWVEGADGKLAYGSIQPEVKEALAQLADMFKQGLLDLEFGVKDAGKVAESIAAGKIGLLYGPQWTSNWPLQDLKNNDPASEWKQIAIVSADGQPAKAQMNFAVGSYYVVRKGYSHPEAVVKLQNLILEKKLGENSDPLYFNEVIDGSPVEVAKYAAVLSGENPLKNIDAYHRVTDAVKAQDPSALNAEENIYYESIVNYQNGDNTGWGLAKIFGENGSFAVIEDAYIKPGNEMPTRFFGAPTATMADKQATLNQLEQELFTRIILGQDSIDAFDKFVEQWLRIGGQAITDEVNVWAGKS